jgi:hypothetical protein
MHSVDTANQQMAATAAPLDREVANTAGQALRRFRTTCVVAIIAAAIPYLWVLWDLWSGTVDPLRVNGTDHNPIYDVQARAIMHGHLWLPGGSISAEAFAHGGHQYTYFGIFPSLLRIPIFLFTSSLDGRLFGLSILGAWMCTALFSSLLLWRLRILLRGEVLLGRCEAVSYGILLGSILVGSVLVYLASVPNVYSEDLAWSVALASGSFFALVGVVECPSRHRVAACGVLVLLTNLNRSTTGYTAILATLLIALWFASGRAGENRRPWALPLAVAGLVPLAIGCAINYVKFGSFFGIPISDQLLFHYYGLSHLNGGKYFGFRYLTSTLQAYVDPRNFRVTSLFPFTTLAPKPNSPIDATLLFVRAPTTSAVVSMPLLVGAGLIGVVAAFMRGRPPEVRALRFVLVAAAVAAGPIMIFGWIYERFVADFMPFLVLSSMIGMVAMWHYMQGRVRARRAALVVVVGVLGLFGFWSNMAFAITPNENWSQTQATNFVNMQRTVSSLTGHPIDHYVVVVGNEEGFFRPAPTGTLFIEGNCAALYVAYTDVPPGRFLPQTVWLLVQRAPDTGLCRALMKDRS